ncbi:ABC transporter ATP-binding protein [Acetivibrio mesophilus]|uniref:ATP-binding cassette domain-containing protein n=1 Tax=Acetivibrio mesophilus TaxID=2487273 RepID=A0A4Q0I5A5_9FIRM|nr:ATP-binding cassette domain-containing protein [Acetivibrio mesophilus]ODM27502.1 ABC transporter [Clostridium sp. Bc-iso-3]RXE59461.1 ATP-binding cassette domain-containing protein [Acetivibrio mesophilus]HHV30252.1 ATP-binding cassette domain-containing protein [Clostridium sp.]
MIEIQNLTKKYGQIVAVDNLNFTVERGEILGFLGPNGAGKSTTMNMITGYLPSTEGTVKVSGYDIAQEPNEVKKRIGYLPENPPLYTDLTVDEYLSFVSELKKVERSKREQQISDIMELLKITDVRKRLIRNLSKGYKQRVGFAQALIGNPEVLILDEPTVGLDPNQILEVRNVIKDLRKEHTIVFSTHIMQEVSAVCERIVIINKGKIVAVDTPENLSKAITKNSRFTIKIAGVKASVIGALKAIDGVKNVEVSDKVEEDVYEYIVDSDKQVDVRKPIFFAMAKLGFPILETKEEELGLEEIFRELTTKNIVVSTESDNSKQDASGEAPEEDDQAEEKEVE